MEAVYSHIACECELDSLQYGIEFAKPYYAALYTQGFVVYDRETQILAICFIRGDCSLIE